MEAFFFRSKHEANSLGTSEGEYRFEIERRGQQ